MVPKLCGQDIEIGNFVMGRGSSEPSGAEASRALLRAVDGHPRTRPSVASGTYPCTCGCGRQIAVPLRSDPQDWGRKWLENGGCCYVDLDHLELATAETTSAFDQVGCTHGMLRVAQRALAAANAARPAGSRITALVNNSDRQGNSYGSHANFLVARSLWDQIFNTRLHYLLYLASFQISSIVFTGQGKVGAENGASGVDFQLSQRADFFETITGPQTTMRRPLVNSRDEALCGGWTGSAQPSVSDYLARLHVIFFDSSLCHVSTLLKLGTMQILLAMMEAGAVDRSLILDDPLAAIVEWSHDPGLRAQAELGDGRRITAVEHQLRFFDAAQQFVEAGRCDLAVPRARDIVARWGQVLSALHAGRVEELESQLDWVLKRSLLRRAMSRRPDLTWASRPIRHLDLLYASLDPDEGLYWAHEREGLVTRVVPESRVEELTDDPPDDTRAWVRGMLLRHAGGVGVEDADWDQVRLLVAGRGGVRVPCTVRLPNPLSGGRRTCEAAFQDAPDLATTIERLTARQDSGEPAAGAAQAMASAAAAGETAH
jgi:Pup amidohydrolase